MENASKALIIAGAILLSIVLITLGVLIIGRGQDAIDKTNIDDQVVSTWNQKWTKYEGKDVRGTTVNNLINEILSSNALADKNKEPEKIIRVTVGTGSNPNELVINGGYFYIPEGQTNPETSGKGLKECKKFANTNAKYTINQFKYNGYGYVCQIYITAQ